MFAQPADHLFAELQRLRLLMHREILRLRASYQLSLDEFRGLYVSDQQVDHLVSQTEPSSNPDTPTTVDLTRRAAALRMLHSGMLPEDFPFARMAREFGLSEFEQDALLLAVAPEIDLKYETVLAYLNNDITRKWPTFDLALRLFAGTPSPRAALRRQLGAESTLFRTGLLRAVAIGVDRPSWLATALLPAAGLCQFLLGMPYQDATTSGVAGLIEPGLSWSEVPISAHLGESLRRAGRLFEGFSEVPPVLVLEGEGGSGRFEAARAVCTELKLPLLRIDCRGLRGVGDVGALIGGLVLQQRLSGAAVYVSRLEGLLDREVGPVPEAEKFIRTLAQAGRPVFIACEPKANWRELLQRQAHLVFHFGEPSYDARAGLWERSMSRRGVRLAAGDIHTLAGRFVLNAGQIEVAAATFSHAMRLRNGDGNGDGNGNLNGDLPALLESARARSGQELSSLAVRVQLVSDWEDLILPPVTLERVRQIAAAVRHRHVVYWAWGMGRRTASGMGVKVLFAGASGTGKTLTASVLAKDLGLELFKIDLSCVVSKYIGETEKNLERVFRAARSSNAILFFDEADAIFGKRSEVKDAHDRYANLELAYLLQRMEDHDGLVILATNLARNIDQAFSRRLHHVVEFPLPDAEQRLQLWRHMFGPEAPLDGGVDLEFLARQFQLPGGDIRNVCLDAAFLAAADGRNGDGDGSGGGTIRMRHLVRATARQMLKQGRVPSAAEFKQYFVDLAQVG